MRKQYNTYKILNELQKFWENNQELRFSQVINFLEGQIDYYDTDFKALEKLIQLNKEQEERGEKD